VLERYTLSRNITQLEQLYTQVWSSGGLGGVLRVEATLARRLFVNSLEGVNVWEKWMAGCELGKSTGIACNWTMPPIPNA